VSKLKTKIADVKNVLNNHRSLKMYCSSE